jgi:hypothetical protein
VHVHPHLLYSYGEDAEDEENLDDNEAGIDAPAVSGCAGYSDFWL